MPPAVKAVILAGGLGTRLSEETHLRPKPMVEIGGRPILWHIMKQYAAHGICDFVICCGYRGSVIKEWFANLALNTSDVTFDLKNHRVDVHECHTEPWTVTCVDTGEHTLTGGRLKRVRRYLDDDEDVCITYGDAVSDIDVSGSIAFHEQHGRCLTMTAVRPPARFGAVELADDGAVTAFREKPEAEGGWINGGFFVARPCALDAIEGDHTSWEHEPLEELTARGDVAAWRHEGFWQPMDTVRDRNRLEELWAGGSPPWRNW
jgi:glucose-1-phosphate cytidylyltransferase